MLEVDISDLLNINSGVYYEIAILEITVQIFDQKASFSFTLN